MNRISDNDKNWGPFTLAPWKNRFYAALCSGDDEDPENHFTVVAFGWALRLKLPTIIRPSGKYSENEREYGFSLSKDSAGYDFFQLYFGARENDGRGRGRWSYHLPWKQWKHVRNSIYEPDGTHYLTEEKGKWREWYELKQACPKSHFGFEDYDGDLIVASCVISEMEWHRGEKWCSWLRFFYPAKIKRCLDMEFSAEVGREKGSWKGGTIGTAIEMLPGESPEKAFKRFCRKDHYAKSGSYRIKFIGACGPPKPKAVTP